MKPRLTDPPNFYQTVTESRQWKAWEEEQRIRLHGLCKKNKLDNGVYDMSEVMECGWISQKHFQDFLKFVTEGY